MLELDRTTQPHHGGTTLVLRLVQAAGDIVFLQGVDGRHILLRQIEIERVEVGLDARSRHGFGQNDISARRAPVDEDLGGCLAEAFSDLANARVVELVAACERRVGLDLDVVFFTEGHEVFALAKGVDFNLVDTGDDFGVLQEMFEVRGAEVGHADRLDDSELLGSLEGSP